jgi:hypothetical protein
MTKSKRKGLSKQGSELEGREESIKLKLAAHTLTVFFLHHCSCSYLWFRSHIYSPSPRSEVSFSIFQTQWRAIELEIFWLTTTHFSRSIITGTAFAMQKFVSQLASVVSVMHLPRKRWGKISA